MSFEDHFDNDRKIVTCLLEYNDYVNVRDDCKLKRTAHTDWSEAVIGWKNVVPFPQYLPPGVSQGTNNKRKNFKNDKSVEFDDWVSENNASVKCVGDNSDKLPVPSWKGHIEQGTYRYVMNNGYYRTMKFLTQNDKREWFTINKKHPEKVSMSWQNRRFQKDIKRQIKRDLHQKVAEKDDTRVIREKTDIPLFKMTKDKPEIILSDRSTKTEKKTRIRSVQSEKPVSCRDKSPLIEFISTEMPTGGEQNDQIRKCNSEQSHINRSTTDLYLNNFTSRISALDRELQNDSNLRKPFENVERSTSVLNKTSAISPKPNLQSKEKEADVVPASSPYRATDFVQQELITVRSMIDASNAPRQELRPIEKVTPAQKLKNYPEKYKKSHSANNTPTQIRYTNATGSDASGSGISTHSIPSHFAIATPELEKALHSYKLAIETTKQSLLSTLSGPKHARRNGGKNLSAPAAIAICDHIASDNTADRTTKDAFLQSKSERRNEIKTKGAPLMVLPEIAGKRMEVSTTSNRWL